MQAGVIVDYLGLSQKSIEITKELNKIDKLSDYWDVVVFFRSFGRIMKPPKFALLPEEELWGFNAPVISTDLKTTDSLLKCFSPTKKFFYLFDLEWISNRYSIDYLSSIYLNEELELIARSKNHARIIESCWKKPIAIIENFNYEQITELLNR